MKTVVIIPARYQSSRFPGKPLVKICGKPLIQHVWEKVIEAVSSKLVYVATDDLRIEQECISKGIQVLKTTSFCLTGTDRVYEASKQVNADIYINVQGDEPLIEAFDIQKVIGLAQKNKHSIINAMCPIKEEIDFRSSTVPKVVTSSKGRLLYISRAPIPTGKKYEFKKAMKQVCIYAFTKDSLERFASVKEKTPLETIEDIEILRFLELDCNVQMIEVSDSSVAVDIPDDVQRVERILNARS